MGLSLERRNGLEWPPENGRRFVRSEEFGRILIGITEFLTGRYPNKDFTDAVAYVFAWFDGKLAKNRRFINIRRFPTKSAFLAYVRQSVWNAARLSERKRRSQERIEAIAADQVIAEFELPPEEEAKLLEVVDYLSEPHKTVFHKYYFEETDPIMIASILDRTEKEIHQIYEEAVDILADKFPRKS